MSRRCCETGKGRCSAHRKQEAAAKHRQDDAGDGDGACSPFVREARRQQSTGEDDEHGCGEEQAELQRGEAEAQHENGRRGGEEGIKPADDERGSARS